MWVRARGQFDRSKTTSEPWKTSKNVQSMDSNEIQETIGDGRIKTK